MIKGAERKMIMLKTNDSGIFESAFFLLRCEVKNPGDTDMVREANRIIGNSIGETAGKVRSRKQIGRWLCFFAGVLTGIALISVCFLLF